MKTIAYILASLIIIFFAACKKNKTTTPTCAFSSSTVIGKWKVTSITVQQNNGQPTEVLNNTLAACERDDLHEFKASGVYSYIDAGTLCSPSGAIDVPNGWSVSGNNFTFFGDTYSVAEFTCTYFKLSQRETLNGLTITTVTTYTKQ